MAKRRVIFYLIFMLIGVGVVESYGYFTWEEKIFGNKISVGKYVDNEFEVRMYASIGPLYENAMSENLNSSRSTNYGAWLGNACDYAIGQIEGNIIEESVLPKSRFSNISSNGPKISPGATMASFYHQSWMGLVDYERENGNMVHFVLAINNKRHKNFDSGFINYKKLELDIGQFDIYEDDKGNIYEIHQNSSNANMRVKVSERYLNFRRKSYVWIKNEQNYGSYIENVKGEVESDLIIIDIGSRPNVSYEGINNKEQGLLDIYEKITGVKEHYRDFSGMLISNWNPNSYMYFHTNSKTWGFQSWSVQKAKLIGIKTEVTVIYDGEVVEKLEPYIINIGEESQEE